jgi:AbrB family looped-hinge helix DNA binding protein
MVPKTNGKVLAGAENSGKTYYMNTTVSTKGQIVIPRGVRQKLGIRSGDRLSARVVQGSIVLRPEGRPKNTARIVVSSFSGLPAIEPPEGAPEISTEQVRAMLADFP